MNDKLNTRRFVLVKDDKTVKVYRCRWPAEPEELEQYPLLSKVKQHDYVIYHAVKVEGKTVWRFYRKPDAPHAHTAKEGHALRIAERLATRGKVELRELFDAKEVRKAKKIHVVKMPLKTEAFPHRRFTCLYANSVAQVYRCEQLSTREEAAEDHPLAKFDVGECFVYYSHLSPTKTYWMFYRKQNRAEVAVLSRAEATDIAERLFDEMDEELRYGFRTGPDAHVMHQNRNHRIYFQQSHSYRKPFVVIRTPYWKVLGAFRTLKDAIRKAEQEDQIIMDNTRR